MTDRFRFSEEQVDAAHELLRKASNSAPLTSETLGNALSLDDIEGNWKARALIIEVMRRKGVPIVARSSGKQRGYWIPTARSEIDEYVRGLYQRAMADMSRAATVEILWRNTHPADVDDQSSLDEEW